MAGRANPRPERHQAMTRYADLIAKTEAALEGSPKLNAMIAEALDWTFMSGWALSESYWIAPDDSHHEMPPPWTESLDAALTLVPEGWGWGANQHSGLCRANVRNESNGETLPLPVGAPTPALALCIAALKARAAEESDT